MAPNRLTVAVAESCTAGLLASEMAATPDSGDWFMGGVVAYHSRIKFQLLGVPEGPVVSENASIAMALGVKTLLETDIGISITGVAGPAPEEGQPVGTVFIGVSGPDGTHSVALVIEGSPERIRSVAVTRALEEVLKASGEIDFEVQTGSQS
jgi:PncC family amidohydrolase